MTEADLDQVIAIERILAEAPHWPPTAYLTALDPQAAPRRIALVAEETTSGNTAGFIIASLLPPLAELETIAVSAEAQRRGLASQLFSALTGELRSNRITTFILELRASNQPALSLYRRLGFVEAGRRPRYYIDPVEDAVLMSLSL